MYFSLITAEIELNHLWNRRQCTKFNGASYISQKGAEAIYTEEGQKQIYENIKYYKDLLNEEMRVNLNVPLKEFLSPKNLIVNEREMLVSDRIYRGFYFYSNYKIIDVMSLNEIIKNNINHYN